MSAARREELTPEGLVVDVGATQGFPRVVVQLAIAAFWVWLGRGLWTTRQDIAFGGDIPGWLEPAAARGWSRPALYTLMAIAAYGALASVVQAIGWLVRHDRIVLGASGWSVSHRFGGGRTDIPWSDTGAPESRAVTGALVVWLSDGTAVPVTALGTPEDRTWIAGEMAQRARGKTDGTPAAGQSRVVGTHRVSREADGTLLVHQTLAGRFGCLAMLGLLGIGLLVYAGLNGFPLVAIVFGIFALASVRYLVKTVGRRIDVRARRGQITRTGRDPLDKGHLVVATTGTSTCEIQLVLPAPNVKEDPETVSLLSFSGTGIATDARQIAGWLATTSGFPLREERD
jgi:hypothetical protein